MLTKRCLQNYEKKAGFSARISWPEAEEDLKNYKPNATEIRGLMLFAKLIIIIKPGRYIVQSVE